MKIQQMKIQQKNWRFAVKGEYNYTLNPLILFPGLTEGFIGCFENNRELWRKSGSGEDHSPSSRNFEIFRETQY